MRLSGISTTQGHAGENSPVVARDKLRHEILIPSSLSLTSTLELLSPCQSCCNLQYILPEHQGDRLDVRGAMLEPVEQEMAEVP